jgi:hypothetical protein
MKDSMCVYTHTHKHTLNSSLIACQPNTHVMNKRKQKSNIRPPPRIKIREKKMKCLKGIGWPVRGS